MNTEFNDTYGEYWLIDNTVENNPRTRCGSRSRSAVPDLDYDTEVLAPRLGGGIRSTGLDTVVHS